MHASILVIPASRRIVADAGTNRRSRLGSFLAWSIAASGGPLRPPAARMPPRRLRGKQPSAAADLLSEVALRAIADESWWELTELSEDAHRKLVHWAHVRTRDQGHRQPGTFTRESFWQHMCCVYRDVYPEPANATGSIVLFGIVVKERHAASPDATERDEHHHCPAYTSLQHYWRPVAKRSLEAYGVKLHAACHASYTTMFTYVRCPTPKKGICTKAFHKLFDRPAALKHYVLRQF